MGKVAKPLPKNEGTESNEDFTQVSSSLTTLQNVARRYLAAKKTAKIPERVVTALQSVKTLATYISNEKRFNTIMTPPTAKATGKAAAAPA